MDYSIPCSGGCPGWMGANGHFVTRDLLIMWWIWNGGFDQPTRCMVCYCVQSAILSRQRGWRNPLVFWSTFHYDLVRETFSCRFVVVKRGSLLPLAPASVSCLGPCNGVETRACQRLLVLIIHYRACSQQLALASFLPVAGEMDLHTTHESLSSDQYLFVSVICF